MINLPKQFGPLTVLAAFFARPASEKGGPELWIVLAPEIGSSIPLIRRVECCSYNGGRDALVSQLDLSRSDAAALVSVAIRASSEYATTAEIFILQTIAEVPA